MVEPVISAETVRKHGSKDDLWMSIHGYVYDVTKFANDHPGGVEILVEHAGIDATASFEDIGHSDHAYELLEQYRVGVLGEEPCEECCCPKKTLCSLWEDNRVKLGVVTAGVAVLAMVAYHFSK